ncbi:MAG: hypothetical protein A2653_02760 [Candidatus Zambryskibacteria bacterium RIFCSPHIGHO2_01_FULL_43_25]|uniref:Uncharacterized protein n=1 Tax=Candidatus Zambryskibacteria bacterium RIFCSPLOWO2_01_FULL_45_21 TaxID=1802761 RepID=A0A1G2U0P5_9BACT|nr:MAG: hypothetical protein A2653_02760 [Candidatus Zambryskibacteria bacterium RIFCSPHIGHO2_01_FULL_43_25]OHB00543.1 MAG: hypothetical protein A3E94_01970 [Candidatus Zambryskibacteria bacterium RIFCSPHIGHO2_12_FULL_44_12b]OHB03043.1 MAG: hypothetical protein A3B14_00045 [Candidatus Zambryskibacteria bacterium RIFCSPLOWO2_01_FULL_45_21]
MPGKTLVYVHKSKTHGYLKFPDGTRSAEFTSIASGALCFLIGVLEERADPDELKSILKQLKSTSLETGSTTGKPVILELKIISSPPGPSLN